MTDLFQAYGIAAPEKQDKWDLFQAHGITPQASAGDLLPEGLGVWRPMAAGMVAAGKSFNDLGQGVRQLYNRAIGDQKTLDSIGKEQEQANRDYAPLKEEFPIAAGLGESAPAGAAMALTGGSTSLPIAALKAALTSGAVEGAKYGTDQERMAQAKLGAAGGAVGTGAGWLLGKAVTPVSRALAPSPETMQAAKAIGYQPTPGQETGNKWLLSLEQQLSRLPMSSTLMGERQAANTAAINRHAASAMGESGDAVNTGMYAAAQTRLNDTFNLLTKNTDVKLGKNYFDAIAGAEREYSKLIGNMPSVADKQVPRVLDDALNLAVKGQLSGEAYQAVRSELSKKAQAAFKGDQSSLGQAYKAIRNALDDAAGESMTVTERAAFVEARKQWGAMKTLVKGNVVRDGDVSPTLLKTQIQAGNPMGYKAGQVQGPLADIARLSEGMKAVADSGTGTNVFAVQAATNPWGLIRSTAAGIPAGLMAKGMLSPIGGGYLKNQALTPEMRRLLMQSGGMLGVGGVSGQ